MGMTKTSSNMLVKNYKCTQNIVHVNQRMKYENESSVQETLQNLKVKLVNN